MTAVAVAGMPGIKRDGNGDDQTGFRAGTQGPSDDENVFAMGAYMRAGATTSSGVMALTAVTVCHGEVCSFETCFARVLVCVWGSRAPKASQTALKRFSNSSQNSSKMLIFDSF